MWSKSKSESHQGGCSSAFGASLVPRPSLQINACAKYLQRGSGNQTSLEHAKSLECQGQVFREVDETAASLWAKAMLTLSPHLLKFSLNAAQDTLPHNVNLSRWRHKYGLSSACRLCGERQTLMPRSSQHMRRYNERHDNVLAVITNVNTILARY